MNETSTIRSKSAADTMKIGRVIASLAKPGDIIALDGELGAGKTQFARGLAEGLGLDTEQVSSPTFVLVHEYEGEPLPLVHIDAYRMSASGELEELGFDELRSGAVVAIEWAARVDEVLGEDRLEVFIEHAGSDERIITLTTRGTWQDRCDQLAVVPCPVCKTPGLAAADDFPFCSPRCRKIDLGRWLNEDYKISRPIEQRDLDEE